MARMEHDERVHDTSEKDLNPRLAPGDDHFHSFFSSHSSSPSASASTRPQSSSPSRTASSVLLFFSALLSRASNRSPHSPRLLLLLGLIAAGTIMIFSSLLLATSGLVSTVPAIAAAAAASTTTEAATNTTSGPLTQYTLSTENITAVFIPYGARLTSLLVADKNGDVQDVIAGYDDPADYIKDTETNHTYFGPIVGRYANRIRNSTFTIDGVTSEILPNEHNDNNTLHGGPVGYDQRNWTVIASDDTSITFTLLDPGWEGFPGSVFTTATYAVGVSPDGSPRLTSTMVSKALDDPTPIMLANHIYWNLNAWRQQTILNDTTLHMPYADRYIKTDTILIPTGELGAVADKPTLDFTSPKLIGADIDDAEGVCGEGCTGYDTAFIVDKPSSDIPTAVDPVLYLSSNDTGISLTVSTNQIGLQIYSCNGQNGTIPVRDSQVKRNKDAGIDTATEYVNKYSCLVIETQAWIDGVNHPEWGVGEYEIFTADSEPVVNFATYDFGVTA